MAKYILATDPRGFRVEFWEGRWDHIINKHQDLIDFHITVEQLKEAIEHPKDGCIYSSHVHPKNSAVYYKWFSEKFDLVVVVRFEIEIGQIVTAHLCGNRPSGERLIWPKTNL